MKAVFCPRYGTPDILEIRDVPKPQPKENEILVRVVVTTVNRTDFATLQGVPKLARIVTGLSGPKQGILGTDFAGEVEGVGSSVQNFKIGDRVWGLDDGGFCSQAEYLTIAEDKAVLKIPEGSSYEQIVSCAEGAHYAYSMFRKVEIEEGDYVLVNGATGAIGSGALQLAKYYGAVVTAVGNGKNIELMTSLGADKTYDYETETFLADDEQYQLIIDAVGKSTYGDCKPLLFSGGSFISGDLGPYAQNLFLPLLTTFSNKKVRFPLPENCRESLLFISELVEKGAFRAIIDREYALEDVKEAYRYVGSGQKTGNVILRIAQD